MTHVIQPFHLLIIALAGWLNLSPQNLAAIEIGKDFMLKNGYQYPR